MGGNLRVRWVVRPRDGCQHPYRLRSPSLPGVTEGRVVSTRDYPMDLMTDLTCHPCHTDHQTPGVCSQRCKITQNRTLVGHKDGCQTLSRCLQNKRKSLQGRRTSQGIISEYLSVLLLDHFVLTSGIKVIETMHNHEVVDLKGLYITCLPLRTQIRSCRAF